MFFSLRHPVEKKEERYWLDTCMFSSNKGIVQLALKKLGNEGTWKFNLENSIRFSGNALG